jgi:acetyl-CoA carboxylase biotin carboxylase subunit
MVRCLRELQVEGIKTTADFQIQVLQHPAFIEGSVDTKWVERDLLTIGT